MEKRYDVIGMGELLVDFASAGKSRQGNGLFEACPGGAPANVLAMLSRWGRKTSFLGKVGKDSFGALLTRTLEEAGIDTSHLYTDDTVPTTLAFVHTLPDGDREFSFYRNPGADLMLTADEVDRDYLRQGRIFHFGTLSMTHEGVRAATKKALRLAKEEGLLISFDPNLRPPLWDSLENARKQMEYGFSCCDILKIADNELQFVTGEEDFDAGVQKLQENYHIPLILLTMGRDGSRAYYGDSRMEKAGFSVPTIEATGAGDTFFGTALHFLLESGLEHLTDARLGEMLISANAAAALITTRKGAIRSMPTAEEVERFLQERR